MFLKTKFEGAVSVVVLVVVEDEPVELEELPPSNAMGKSAVRGDCPFLPLQPARLNDRIRLRASKRSEK